jgi:hypothetical protein
MTNLPDLPLRDLNPLVAAEDPQAYINGRQDAAATKGYHREFAWHRQHLTQFGFARSYWTGYLDWCADHERDLR